MSTVFTKIIEGEFPGTFVWRDDRCVGFMSINPMAAGHVLVVPVEEIDHWLDASAELAAHLFSVARTIALAQRSAFDCERIGVIVAGYATSRDVPAVDPHPVPHDDRSFEAPAHVPRRHERGEGLVDLQAHRGSRDVESNLRIELRKSIRIQRKPSDLRCK